MGKFLIMLLAACVAFLVLWIVLGKKKKLKEHVDTYTCSVCGEKDCSCHKEENA